MSDRMDEEDDTSSFDIVSRINQLKSSLPAADRSVSPSPSSPPLSPAHSANQDTVTEDDAPAFDPFDTTLAAPIYDVDDEEDDIEKELSEKKKNNSLWDQLDEMNEEEEQQNSDITKNLNDNHEDEEEEEDNDEEAMNDDDDENDAENEEELTEVNEEREEYWIKPKKHREEEEQEEEEEEQEQDEDGEEEDGETNETNEDDAESASEDPSTSYADDTNTIDESAAAAETLNPYSLLSNDTPVKPSLSSFSSASLNPLSSSLLEKIRSRSSDIAVPLRSLEERRRKERERKEKERNEQEMKQRKAEERKREKEMIKHEKVKIGGEQRNQLKYQAIQLTMEEEEEEDDDDEEEEQEQERNISIKKEEMKDNNESSSSASVADIASPPAITPSDDDFAEVLQHSSSDKEEVETVEVTPPTITPPPPPPPAPVSVPLPPVNFDDFEDLVLPSSTSNTSETDFFNEEQKAAMAKELDESIKITFGIIQKPKEFTEQTKEEEKEISQINTTEEEKEEKNKEISLENEQTTQESADDEEKKEEFTTNIEESVAVDPCPPPPALLAPPLSSSRSLPLIPSVAVSTLSAEDELDAMHAELMSKVTDASDVVPAAPVSLSRSASDMSAKPSRFSSSSSLPLSIPVTQKRDLNSSEKRQQLLSKAKYDVSAASSSTPSSSSAASAGFLSESDDDDDELYEQKQRLLKMRTEMKRQNSIQTEENHSRSMAPSTINLFGTTEETISLQQMAIKRMNVPSNNSLHGNSTFSSNANPSNVAGHVNFALFNSSLTSSSSVSHTPSLHRHPSLINKSSSLSSEQGGSLLRLSSVSSVSGMNVSSSGGVVAGVKAKGLARAVVFKKMSKEEKQKENIAPKKAHEDENTISLSSVPLSLKRKLSALTSAPTQTTSLQRSKTMIHTLNKGKMQRSTT